MKLIIGAFFILFCTTAISCKKEWLEKKSDQALLIPVTLEDCQLLLNNSDILNIREPALGEIGTDTYYSPYNSWLLKSDNEKNAYAWLPRIYGTYSDASWANEYEKIYYANAILSTLDKIATTNSNLEKWNTLRGSALFFRASGHYNLVSLFARPWEATSAEKDPGIPVKTTPDINQKAARGNVKMVYDQILADLKEAITLLPSKVEYLTRPAKAAANGLLADIYLNMGEYDKSLRCADDALTAYAVLLNYNDYNPAGNTPFTRFNKEVIFHYAQSAYAIISDGTSYIDTLLYKSYEDNDLRKVLYFRNRGAGYTFKGSYNQSGSYSFFSGLATDELYLIRAECLARTGNTAGAMNDLNTLLVTRWKAGTFVKYTAASPAEALTVVLKERRKELVFRGRRWNDLRRLNKESDFAITIQRKLNGETYTLPPNDPRYVLPIPDEEIKLSGMEQNKRD